MKRRVFVGAGITLIGAGALFSTGGFSALNADRGVAVSTAADHEGAFLGINNVDTTDDPVFTNNTSLWMEVRLIDDDPDTTLTFDGNESPYAFPLSADESETVTIETEGDSQSALTTITAELFSGETKAGEITLQRDFSVPQSEITDFTGTAKSAGNSGKFEFELENTGDKSVTLTGIGIDATTRGDVIEVARQDKATLSGSLGGGKQDLVMEPIPIDSSAPETHTRRDFETNFELPSGSLAEFEFERFRDENDKVSMENENIRVTLYFGDDSSKTIDLCLDETICGSNWGEN